MVDLPDPSLPPKQKAAKLAGVARRGENPLDIQPPSPDWIPAESRADVDPPFATLAYYGPDPTQATKAVLTRIDGYDEAAGGMEKWQGEAVQEDGDVQQAIEATVDEWGLDTLVVSKGVAGCPHEENVDFPEGQDCPECEFWAGLQGSGGLNDTRFLWGVQAYRKRD